MSDILPANEDPETIELANLTDEQQVDLAEQTDNGPSSAYDERVTASLPQDPGSVVE